MGAVRTLKTAALKPRMFPNIPGRYSDDLCAYILTEIGNGRSLVSVCEEPGMPSKGTVAGWTLADYNFARLYIHARRKRAIIFAEEIITTADGDGGVETKEKIARDALAIKTRQWVMERDLPELFGQFKEREEKPLPILNNYEERGKDQLSSDPIEAARQYQKIMGASAIAKAYNSREEDLIGQIENESVNLNEGAPPELNGYADDLVRANIDPHVIPPPPQYQAPPVADRPKFADRYDTSIPHYTPPDDDVDPD